MVSESPAGGEHDDRMSRLEYDLRTVRNESQRNDGLDDRDDRHHDAESRPRRADGVRWSR